MFLDTEDYSDPEQVTKAGYSPIGLAAIKDRLGEHRIEYREVPIEYGMALVLLSLSASKTT